MMKCLQKKCYKWIFIPLLLSLVLFTSCTSFKKPFKNDSEQKNGEAEMPKELNELSKSIEKIEKTLQEFYEKEKKPEKVSEEENEGGDNNKENPEEENKGQENSGGSENESKKKDEEDKEKLQVQLKPEELSKYEEQKKEIEKEKKKEKDEKEKLKGYESLKKDVVELHNLWNSAEPKLIKNLVPQLPIDNFESALNFFTNNIETPDVYANLVALIELYRYLPDFSEAYKTKYPPDIDRLKFAIKKISLISDKDDYNNLGTTLNYLSERWEKTKPKLDKKTAESINKFDLALSDLKASITSKDKNIIKVKSGVLLNVIEGLIKESKEDKQEKS